LLVFTCILTYHFNLGIYTKVKNFNVDMTVLAIKVDKN
jgi:hypothetical protein